MLVFKERFVPVRHWHVCLTETAVYHLQNTPGGFFIMEKQKYYITTAIAYTSGKPHIGNTYEAVLADAIARYKRLEGYDVFFQTGTDEHVQKIELKSE